MRRVIAYRFSSCSAVLRRSDCSNSTRRVLRNVKNFPVFSSLVKNCRQRVSMIKIPKKIMTWILQNDTWRLRMVTIVKNLELLIACPFPQELLESFFTPSHVASVSLPSSFHYSLIGQNLVRQTWALPSTLDTPIRRSLSPYLSNV